MATSEQLVELVSKLYEVRSFADSIEFRIEEEIDNIIDIIESEITEAQE